MYYTKKGRFMQPSSLGLCRLATCSLTRSKKLGGSYPIRTNNSLKRNCKLSGLKGILHRPVLFSSIRDGHKGIDSTSSFRDSPCLRRP